MKRLLIHILAISALATSASAQNQDLNQQITVDRTIAPTERSATRLSTATPLIIDYNGKPVTLKSAEYTRASTLSSSLQFLEPATWRDSIDVAPWRGYAGIGFFPLYNLWADAGMKFIDNTRMRLGAWLQYNGASYHGRLADDYNPSFTWHQFNAGLSGDYAFNTKSSINANVSMLYDWRNMPYLKLANESSASNSALGFNLDATFMSKIKAVDYHAGVTLSYFGFGKDAFLSDMIVPDASNLPVHASLSLNPAKEFMPGFNIGAAYTVNNIGRLTVDITGNYSFNNNLQYIALATGSAATPEYKITSSIPSSNSYLTEVNPRLHIEKGKFTCTAGFKASFYSYQSSEVNFAPDVLFSYTHSSNLSAYAGFTGGMEQMSLKRIFEISPYAMQCFHHRAESTPVNLDFGVNFGPYAAGFSASAFAGFNKVNNYLTPMVDMLHDTPVNEFTPTPLTGWHAGIKIAYSYKTLGEAHLSAQTASQSATKGYAPWRDKARYVLSLGVSAHPLDKLTVGADFQLRALRRGYALISVPLEQPLAGDLNSVEAIVPFNLHNSSNLSINANYALNTQFSIFATVENLLNHRSYLIFGVPAQRIHGLIGVTYKIK